MLDSFLAPWEVAKLLNLAPHRGEPSLNRMARADAFPWSFATLHFVRVGRHAARGSLVVKGSPGTVQSARI